MTNTAVATSTFVPLIQGRETIAANLRNTVLYLTIGIAYTPEFCEGDQDGPLGSCGCYDYHYSDCPLRG
jgi:hypothetical protein